MEQNTLGNNQRLEWLDVLKCLVMWLVVIGHMTQDYTNDTYRYYIYAFHMPLFFMISGSAYYLQQRKRDFDFRGILDNKIRTLLLPYLAFNLLAIPIYYLNYDVLGNGGTASIPELLFAIFYSNQDAVSSPTNATWFLVTLFIANICFFIIMKWSENNEKTLVLACAVVCSFGYSISIANNDFNTPWHLETVPIAVGLFAIGYVAMNHIDVLMKFLGSRKRQLLWVIILFPSAFCCAAFNVKISMAGNTYGSFLLFICAVIGFSIICLIVSLNIPAFKILQFIGRNTIVILAFHCPCIRFLENASELTLQLVQDYPILVGTAIFIFMIPVCYIFERWFPFLMGRKKRRR